MDYKQLLFSTAFVTGNQSSTALDVDHHEVGDAAPQPQAVGNHTCWVQVDYSMSLSVAQLIRYLANPANGPQYPHKEETSMLPPLVTRRAGRRAQMHSVTWSDTDWISGKRKDAPAYVPNRPSYPKQIVVYRDCVSESRSQMVLKDEWPQVQHVIRSRYSDDNRQELPRVFC